MARTRAEQRGEGASGGTMKASSSDVSDTQMRSGESAARAAELGAEAGATSTGARAGATSTGARAASSPDAMASRSWAGAGGRASKCVNASWNGVRWCMVYDDEVVYGCMAPSCTGECAGAPGPQSNARARACESPRRHTP